MTNKTKIIAETDKQELFIIRDFDAPQGLVFKAFSEPELLVQWMGPKEMDTIIEKLDNKSHGSWRISHKEPNGNIHSFNGAIHEVYEPERIIRTFEYEGISERGHVSLEFLNLENLENDKCRMTVQVIYKSVSDRDNHIQSGMERGVIDSHERLDVLLKCI
jgi:uncharacterized protein YndB with AHSA1/START domain